MLKKTGTLSMASKPEILKKDKEPTPPILPVLKPTVLSPPDKPATPVPEKPPAIVPATELPPMPKRARKPVDTRPLVKVLFDHTAENPDELTIKTNQFIHITKKNDGGWWEGELDGKVGWFPDNFVAPATAAEVAAHNGADDGEDGKAEEAEQPPALPVRKVEEVKKPEAVAPKKPEGPCRSQWRADSRVDGGVV